MTIFTHAPTQYPSAAPSVESHVSDSGTKTVLNSMYVGLIAGGAALLLLVIGAVVYFMRGSRDRIVKVSPTHGGAPPPGEVNA